MELLGKTEMWSVSAKEEFKIQEENNESLFTVHTIWFILLLKTKAFQIHSRKQSQKENSECCFWDKKEYSLRFLKSSVLDSVS